MLPKAAPAPAPIQAKKKAEEERLKAEAEAKKKAEEERLKAEAEAKKKAEEERLKAGPHSAQGSWFHRFFGFEEFPGGAQHDVFAHVRKQLVVETSGDKHDKHVLINRSSGKRFWVGCYTQQSLQELALPRKVRMRAPFATECNSGV